MIKSFTTHRYWRSRMAVAALVLSFLGVTLGAAQAQPVRGKLDKVVREGLAVARDDAPIRVIITLAPNARQGVLAKLRAHGVQVSHDFTIIPAMAAQLPAGLVRSLEKDKDVVAISYDDDVAASGISSTVTGTAANSPYTLRATLGLDEAIVRGATSMTSGTKKTNLAWAHTVGSGSHRLLVVSTAHRDGTKSVTGVTYGGAALTQIAAQRGPSSNNSATSWTLGAGKPW